MTGVDELTHGLDELRDSIARTAQVAPQVARQEIRREGRAYFRGAVVASVITSLLVGVPLALVANQLSEHANADQVRAAQFQAQAQNIQQLAQSAHDLGVQANAELTRRGLATVPIPTPGTAPDSQVFAAASTAQIAGEDRESAPRGAYSRANPGGHHRRAGQAAPATSGILPSTGHCGGAGLLCGQRPGTAWISEWLRSFWQGSAVPGSTHPMRGRQRGPGTPG